MKVIQTYSLLVTAQLAQLELGSYGIKAEILDESLAVTAPNFAMSDGIRLAVLDEDEDQAKAILSGSQEEKAD